jgi:hypothetical protein
LVSSEAKIEARRRELDEALIAFWTFTVLAVSELTRLPVERTTVDARAARRVSSLVAKIRGPERQFLAIERGRRKYLGDRQLEIADRAAAALARLRLLGLRPELEKPFLDAADYLIALGARRQQDRDEWPARSQDLRLAIARVRAHPDPTLPPDVYLDGLLASAETDGSEARLASQATLALDRGDEPVP